MTGKEKYSRVSARCSLNVVQFLCHFFYFCGSMGCQFVTACGAQMNAVAIIIRLKIVTDIQGLIAGFFPVFDRFLKGIVVGLLICARQFRSKPRIDWNMENQSLFAHENRRHVAHLAIELIPRVVNFDGFFR